MISLHCISDIHSLVTVSLWLNIELVTHFLKSLGTLTVDVHILI